MVEFSFEVPGEPIGKGRPRFNTKTGHAYTPAATTKAENAVAWECKRQVAEVEFPISDGLIAIELRFYSSSNEANPAGRTDIDNLQKLVMDALNKVAWDDDWRIVEAKSVLYRGVPKDEARTQVIVYTFAQDESEAA